MYILQVVIDVGAKADRECVYLCVRMRMDDGQTGLKKKKREGKRDSPASYNRAINRKKVACSKGCNWQLSWVIIRRRRRVVAGHIVDPPSSSTWLGA